MRRTLLTFITAVSLLGFSSCGMNVLRGEGVKTTQARQVATFDAVDISVSSDIKITVTEGTTPGVTLAGYENIIKHIKTEVKDNMLYVSFDLDDTWTVNEDDMEIRIGLPALKALTLSGAPDVDIHGNITGTEFDLDVSGTSSITIDNINVNKFTVDMSGLAGLEVRAGSVKSVEYEISGGGKIEAYPMQTEETSTSISGLGENEISVSKKLDASISGAGSVKYKGTPVITKHISGAGSVSAAL